ncbi:MAG: rhomboid family intramembrane serine protease [Verrucomicrobiota bacterium]|jgi:GlpG protein
MRLIGHLKNEDAARTFADYLASLDVRSLVEADAEGYAVWVYSEDQIEASHQALAAFLKNPNDAKFHDATRNAAALEQRRRREEAAAAARIHTRERIFTQSGRAPLTIVLIGVCVMLALVGGLPPAAPVLRWLLISNWPIGFLPEVRAGQLWRLVTPIFIHFSLMHIFFNAWMLYDLGRLVETRQGTKRLALLVLVLGVGSNLGQYIIAGPGFGGMSGVLYGLIGYAWLRGHCDPSSGLELAPMTLGVMLVWFFLCLFQVIPNVANGTHAVGLVMGMIWGAAPMATKLFRP